MPNQHPSRSHTFEKIMTWGFAVPALLGAAVVVLLKIWGESVNRLADALVTIRPTAPTAESGEPGQEQ